MIKVETGLLPLHILHPEEEVPNEWLDKKGTKIFQQGDNVFKVCNTGLYSYISSMDDEDDIKEQYYKNCRYDPKLVYLQKFENYTFPLDEFKYVMRYFQWIYDTHKTEAAVLLLVNNNLKLWKPFFVLQASGGGASVTYVQPSTESTSEAHRAINHNPKVKEIQDEIIEEYNKLYNQGWRIFGTIHSHCNFNAFHSGVDDADEKEFDGLHITIGNVRSGWSYSARVMLQGCEFKQDIEEILQNKKEEFEENISDIEILEAHTKLMMPNLISEYRESLPKKPQKAKKITDYSGWYDWKERNNGYSTVNDFDNLFDLSDDDDDEYEENVWEASEVIYVVNFKSGEALFVKTEYFFENRESKFDGFEIINSKDNS